MSTAISLFGGTGGKVALTSNSDALKKALDSSVHDDPRGSPEDGVYINFTGKRGVYEIGVDKDNADPNEIWLVNVTSFESGWVCWKGGRPVAKRMASIFGDPVPIPDQGEHGPFNTNNGEGWSPCKSMSIRSLDTGVQGVFSTNSKSGVSSLVGIQKEVSARLADDAVGSAWPIIHLSSEKFTAQGNTNYKPIFPVFGWLGDAQINHLASLEEIAEGVVDDLCNDAENGVTDYGHDDGEEVEAEAELVEDEAEVVEEVETVHSESAEPPKKTRSRTPTPTPGTPNRRRATV